MNPTFGLSVRPLIFKRQISSPEALMVSLSNSVKIFLLILRQTFPSPEWSVVVTIWFCPNFAFLLRWGHGTGDFETDYNWEPVYDEDYNEVCESVVIC